jgi:hypothetical protein
MEGLHFLLKQIFKDCIYPFESRYLRTTHPSEAIYRKIAHPFEARYSSTAYIHLKEDI